MELTNGIPSHILKEKVFQEILNWKQFENPNFQVSNLVI